jgi:hypothetical protein
MILDTNAISDFADANQRLLDRIQQADDDLHRVGRIPLWAEFIPSSRGA